MVETEFVVRCSGRMDYVRAVFGAAIMGGIFTWVNQTYPLPLELLYSLVAILTVISIVAAFIRAKIQYIDVDDEGITMHRGLFNKKTTYVPYERVTNVQVHRSFWERLFMLGMLQIDTAGTNQKEIVMYNIPSHYLDKLAKSVHSHIGGS
ncbi:PH domain-containing protein [Candidatus Micrarchaeota archaeon]|nr:PH domain-containing protein [Candidatus Micrarchaeota archaeon]MBD3418061.1 PH domain-containing protein [Candidatus Micrarchaeota archaeon]